jgi:hypothetical protein
VIAIRRLARRVAARLANLGDGLPLNLSTPAQIESLGRFRLTPGVRVIEAEARTSARFETHFAARLSLPSSQLETFLAGTLVQGLLSADSPPRDLLLRTRGMRSFLAGQAVHGNTQQVIVVDTGDPEQFVVHILTQGR